MKWSWRLCRIAGIDIFMHATFLILLAWVAIAHYLQRNSWADAVYGLVFVITLFAIVVLHELGHALTARRFGIRTRDITLLPIGGLARLERMPEDPKQELLVALAGPAVNVALAVVFFVIVALTGDMAQFGEFSVIGGSFLAKLFWINVALAIFNLLPAFPMDGGRVLRAMLAMRMDYVQATQTAASVGQAMALMFGLLGMLLFNPILLFIAFFVWMGATAEASMVQLKSALGGIPVRHAMITEFHALGPDDPLSHVVDRILAGYQDDFPVVVQGEVVGMLTRSDVAEALAKEGRDVPVGSVMQREFETADPAEMLEDVLLRLETSGGRSMPVTRDDVLVGVLTKENLGEFLMFQPFFPRRGKKGAEHVPAVR